MSEPGTRTVRNPRAPYFLVAAVCGAIILGAALTGTAKRDRSDQGPAAPPSVDRVEDQLLGAPPPRGDGASTAERAAAMTESREARREERKQKLQDARLAMASRFGQETVDPAWSAGKEASLQAVAESPTFVQAGIVPDSLRIDCKRSVCKINATHASYGASADWAMIYMTSSAGEVTHTFTKSINNPDGTTSVEIYAQAR